MKLYYLSLVCGALVSGPIFNLSAHDVGNAVRNQQLALQFNLIHLALMPRVIVNSNSQSTLQELRQKSVILARQIVLESPQRLKRTTKQKKIKTMKH